MKKYKISLITLCYNQLEEATKPFIESLYKFTDSNIFELIIVNNNSTDGTKEYLREMENHYENIKIINNEENFGFSKGNNIGIQHAEGEYIVLINNDTLLTPNWLDNLIKILDNNPEIGIVSPLTNGTLVKPQLIRHHKTLTPQNYLKYYKMLLENPKRSFKYSDKVIFFCVALKKETIERIGMLDEKFGLAWFEDDDYCLRILEVGLKVAIATNTFVYHNCSKTSSKLAQTQEGLELVRKNSAYFYNKHFAKIIELQSVEIRKIKSKLNKKFNFLIILLIANFLFTLSLVAYLILGKA